MHHLMGDFELGGMAMRYSLFVPRLYNYCLSLGFQRERMMPSRAFCSDETQGYPTILLMQHFGTFPFDHGLVGGRVATNRHGPHAHHGEDLVLIQASHVGYDPDSGRFGVSQRQRTAESASSDNCGKLCAVLQWYQDEYRHACEHIGFGGIDGRPAIFIDNQLLDESRSDGLFLRLDRLIDEGSREPLKVLSTSKAFPIAQNFEALLPKDIWKGDRTQIGNRLSADMFFFRHQPVEGPEGHDLLEAALAPVMPALVTSPRPALDAARYHTQVEFDRTFRSIQRESAYRGKNLLFVAGLNIDISPPNSMLFPLTKFVPWAAYGQFRDGTTLLLEQHEFHSVLLQQSTENADQTSLDAAIRAMAEVESIDLPQ